MTGEVYWMFAGQIRSKHTPGCLLPLHRKYHKENSLVVSRFRCCFRIANDSQLNLESIHKYRMANLGMIHRTLWRHDQLRIVLSSSFSSRLLASASGFASVFAVNHCNSASGKSSPAVFNPVPCFVSCMVIVNFRVN